MIHERKVLKREMLRSFHKTQDVLLTPRDIYDKDSLKSDEKSKNTMKIHEHRGFNIEVQKVEEGYISEIYRKGKRIRTVRHDKSQFHSQALAIEAAREWIDRTYPPGRIKYFGEV